MSLVNSWANSAVRDLLNDMWYPAVLYGTQSVTTSDIRKSFAFEKLGDDSYQLCVPMPGVGRDAIDVSVSDSYVTVGCLDSKAKFVSQTTVFVSLPKDAQSDTLASTYVDGVVTVTCKKGKSSTQRKIALG